MTCVLGTMFNLRFPDKEAKVGGLLFFRLSQLPGDRTEVVAQFSALRMAFWSLSLGAFPARHFVLLTRKHRVYRGR